MAKKIKVTLVKSLIGRTPKQRKTIKALGLGKLNSNAVHNPTPDIEGMLRKVKHLVKVEETGKNG